VETTWLGWCSPPRLNWRFTNRAVPPNKQFYVHTNDTIHNFLFSLDLITDDKHTRNAMAQSMREPQCPDYKTGQNRVAYAVRNCRFCFIAGRYYTPGSTFQVSCPCFVGLDTSQCPRLLAGYVPCAIKARAYTACCLSVHRVTTRVSFLKTEIWDRWWRQ
jgi:hypothetical protein